jgi:hypothetical protein
MFINAESVIVDDLIVPMNSTCTLQGVGLKGNISVYEGAVLYAYAVMLGAICRRNMLKCGDQPGFLCGWKHPV